METKEVFHIQGKDAWVEVIWCLEKASHVFRNSHLGFNPHTSHERWAVNVRVPVTGAEVMEMEIADGVELGREHTPQAPPPRPVSGVSVTSHLQVAVTPDGSVVAQAENS